MKTYRPTKELIDFANEVAEYIPTTTNKSQPIYLSSSKGRYMINIYGRIPLTNSPARVNHKTKEIELSRVRIKECKSEKENGFRDLTIFLIFWSDCRLKVTDYNDNITVDNLVIDYMIKKGYSKYNMFVGIVNMMQGVTSIFARERIINIKYLIK